jgi:hypothetical protein
MNELEFFLKRTGYVDASDNKIRNKAILTFCLCFIGTALGCGIGSTIMLTWFKPFFSKMVF